MQQPADKITLLDGAVGTEMERRGYRTRLPLWSALANREAPELVRRIHEEYVTAGAEVITANTFRTSVYTYQKAGLPAARVKEDLSLAMDIGLQAIKARNGSAVLAASIASLEDCYRPDLTPPEATLKAFHEQQIELLKEAGYELILVETMHTLSEAECIASLCHQAGLKYFLSFIPGTHGKLLSGESLMTAIRQIEAYYPSGLLLNCRPFHTLNHQLTYLKSFKGQVGIYANGSGGPDEEFGWRFDSEHPEMEFLENSKLILQQGIQIIGGCCGTRPEDIRAISEYLDKA